MGIQNTRIGIRETSRVHGARGLSLLETVVWMAVLILVLTALVSMITSFYRANRYTIAQADAVGSAQRGLDQIIRTIREGAYSAQGAFPIVSIAQNDFVLYADMDTDPLVERVHYFLSGAELVRGITEAEGNPPAYTGGEATSTRASYVRNTDEEVALFRYYDEVGSEITDYNNWASVRFVTATLVVDVDTAHDPGPVVLTSSAAIRNLSGK